MLFNGIAVVHCRVFTAVRVNAARQEDVRLQSGRALGHASAGEHATSRDSVTCYGARKPLHALASDDKVLSGLDAGRGEWTNGDSPYTEALCQLVDSCRDINALSSLIQDNSSRMSAFVAGRVASHAERLLGQADVNTVARQNNFAKVLDCISSHVSSMSHSGLINVLSLALLLSGHKASEDLAAAAVSQLPASSIQSASLYLRHFTQLLLITSAFCSVIRDHKSSVYQSMTALSRAVLDHITSIAPSVTVRDAVTACKILASFRHRHHIPLATLQPVCVALSAHAERSLLEYNATQLIITLTSLHSCGHAPKTLYAAVAAALATDRLGHLSSRHRVSLLAAFYSAGQPLPVPVRNALVYTSLDACASLTRADDIASLARAAAATPGLPPARGLPLAEHIVRHATEMPPSTAAATLAALLRLGCVHGGAIAAFRGTAAPRVGELQWWQLPDSAACCAHPACVRSDPPPRPP